MKRKRINILFTTLNILVIAGMFIHIAISYFNFSKDANGTYLPPEIVFMWSLAYILPLLLLNFVWALVQKIASRKQADSPSADVLARAAVRSEIVNIVFLVVNIAIVVIMVISAIRSRKDFYFHYLFFDVLNMITTTYSVPLITLNTAWCVIHMNIKKKD